MQRLVCSVMQAVQLLIAAMVLTTAASQQQQVLWNQQRDVLDEYDISDLAIVVRSLSECLTKGSDRQWQAAQFDETSRTCQLLSCRLGENGCRKCRHAVNSSLPMLWVKSMNEKESSNCWKTVQHRVDDSMNFTRIWSDYDQGFGEDPRGNYWIGLRTLSSLTYPTGRRLRVEMKLWNETFAVMEYSSFVVAPESVKFTLISLGSYSSYPGTYGDGMRVGEGRNFSTIDNDNDLNAESCSALYRGGWWYANCHSSNPNGVYYNLPIAVNTPTHADGIVWGHVAGHHYSMKEMEFMIAY